MIRKFFISLTLVFAVSFLQIAPVFANEQQDFDAWCEENNCEEFNDYDESDWDDYDPDSEEYDWYWEEDYEGEVEMEIETTCSEESGECESFEDDDGFEEDDDDYEDQIGYEFDTSAWGEAALSLYDIYYRVEDVFDILSEIEDVRNDYMALEKTMPQDISAALLKVRDEAEAIVNSEGLIEIYSQLSEIIESAGDDSAKMGELLSAALPEIDMVMAGEISQSLEGFWLLDPWLAVDQAWYGVETFEDFDDIEAEIEDLREDMAEIKDFLAALENILVTEAHFTNARDNLNELIEEAEGVLDSIQEKLATQTDPYEVEEYWDILEDIGEVAMHHMRTIFEYLKNNQSILNELKSMLPDGSSQLLESMIMQGKEYGKEEQHDSEDFYDHYGKSFDEDFQKGPGTDFFKQIESEVYDKVLRYVSENLMSQLAPYLGDEESEKVITRILNGFQAFDKNFATELLENQSKILKELTFDLENAGSKKEEIRKLLARTKNSVIQSKYVEKLSSLWQELYTLIRIGASTEDYDKKIKEISAVLEENHRENVLGEKPVEFYDVSFDDQQWYWEPVMRARGNGVINGYSDDKGPTGYFGPSDNVTYAQALKMSLEAIGHGKEMVENSKNWYEGYLKKLDSLGLNRLNSKTYSNWDAPAKRKDIVIMINEIFGIGPVDYVAGTFSDVSPDSQIAKDAMASYLAGIFTGEGETGSLNGEGNINRAGFAKVIGIAMDYYEKEHFAQSLTQLEL